MTKSFAVLAFVLVAVSLLGCETKDVRLGTTPGGGPPTSLLPPERRIDWRAGVPGGIPIRSAVCANVRDAAFGAIGDGVADDAPAIQRAIDACSAEGVVSIPAGTYRLGAFVQLGSSNVTVRGAGPDATTLRFMGTSGGAVVAIRSGMLDWNFSSTASFDVTSGATRTSTALTLATAPDFSAGAIALLDVENDGVLVVGSGVDGACTYCGRQSGARTMGQLVRVTHVAANLVSVDAPLYLDFADRPQVSGLRGLVTRAGIEDLTIEDASGAAADNISFEGAVQSWVRNVRSVDASDHHVYATYSLECEVRECEMLTRTAASAHFGVGLGFGTTAMLVEDDVVRGTQVGIALQGSVSGNVIGYDVVSDLAPTAPGWTGVAFFESEPHPMMNLIEGNVFAGRIAAGPDWGSGSHNTYFRNRVYVEPAGGFSYGSWLVDVYATHSYENVLANVLGVDGYETDYEVEGLDFTYYNSKIVFRLGYVSSGDADASGNDPRVKQTLLRRANYDFIHRAAVWDPGDAPQALPASLYRAARPSWFDPATGWPAIGPDVVGLESSTAAAIRYTAATGATLR